MKTVEQLVEESKAIIESDGYVVFQQLHHLEALCKTYHQQEMKKWLKEQEVVGETGMLSSSFSTEQVWISAVPCCSKLIVLPESED